MTIELKICRPATKPPVLKRAPINPHCRVVLYDPEKFRLNKAKTVSIPSVDTMDCLAASFARGQQVRLRYHHIEKNKNAHENKL